MTDKPPLLLDSAEREHALDPHRSFIVQAPAGSGKTGLLTQRFIGLLALVDQPEEVIAITFTIKAASEMRSRILKALAQAEAPLETRNDFESRTRELAGQALARDREKQWGLLDTPSRLRIMTIDALCASIARYQPLLSATGGLATITSNASILYRDAARGTLENLEKNHPLAEAIETLLKHLDNDLTRITGMLADMLAKRDQWLRHLETRELPALRMEIEAGYGEIIATNLERLNTLVPERVRAELPPLAAFANQVLDGADPDEASDPPDTAASLPGTGPEELPRWQALTDLCFTAGGTLRASLNKNQGFPPGQKKMKSRMEALLKEMASHPEFCEAFLALKSLPPHRFTDDQWEITSAMISLLPLAVQYLERLFSSRGELDFIEVARSALRAIEADPGSDRENPALDYPIRHLLVDEFQDTSLTQFRLIEGLTAHWNPGEGQTLFLVGDPMQSIYRFREAEVGLFLRVWKNGIGRLRPDPLTLSTNFRSLPSVVAWVNSAFSLALPRKEDIWKGAVRYSPSEAVHLAEEPSGVMIHPLIGESIAEEARMVADLVEKSRSENPGGTIAILVRVRNHLNQIILELRNRGLTFQAVEIDALMERPVVQDLLSLARALIHPGDRVAWLALLRSPLCGLSLADLLALCGSHAQTPLMDLILDTDRHQSLSAGGQAALARLAEALPPSLAKAHRLPLRRVLESAWLALGGAVGLTDHALMEAASLFGLIETMEQDHPDPAQESLLEAVEQLYSPPDPTADGSLQLMTIHKAKGLEFDTVILPGLGRGTRGEDQQMLLWNERPKEKVGESTLLVANVSGPAETNRFNEFLREVNREKNLFETGRLLYVAVTRARRQAHLLGHTRTNRDDELSDPAKNTLLRQIWGTVSPLYAIAHLDWLATEKTDETGPATAEPENPQQLQRLPHSWRPMEWPEEPLSTDPHSDSGGAGDDNIEFLWASDTARFVGTVVHRILQRMTSQGTDRLTADQVDTMERAIHHHLITLGVPRSDLEGAMAKTREALANTLADPRGQWILAPHQEAESELSLTGVIEGKTMHLQIDRTFLDEQGTRWIIDYKTGTSKDPAAFLQREEERYRGQLERYARLMRVYDPDHPVRLALYFPLLLAWREWEPVLE